MEQQEDELAMTPHGALDWPVPGSNLYSAICRTHEWATQATSASMKDLCMKHLERLLEVEASRASSAVILPK